MKKFFQVDDSCALYLTNKKKSDTVWSDLSKKGNSGTIYGASPDRLGYYLDGVDDWILGAAVFSSDIKTILFWMNASSWNGNTRIITTTDESYRILNDSNNGKVGFYFANSVVTIDLRWQFLVFVTDNIQKTASIYVDGSIIINNLGQLNDIGTSGNLVIGLSSGLEDFNGYIDDFRIYNRALSASEVLAHYGKTRKFYGV